MKFSIKKIIIIVLIVGGTIGWYFWNKSEQAKIAIENEKKLEYTVKRGDIKNEVKVTAIAKLANEQNLSFGQEGKITHVYVKVGDEVKAGQILAELKMDDYENAINTAKLELENAKIGLTKLLNNDTSVREAQLKSQIKEANANLDVETEQKSVLKKQLETAVSQKQDALALLKKQYELDQKNLDIAKSQTDISKSIESEQTKSSLTTRKQTIESIINSLNSTLTDAELIVESVDKIFGAGQNFKDNNNDYEVYLGARDNNLKSKTQTDILAGYALIENYKKEFSKINVDISDDDIYNIVQKYYDDTIILEKMCNDAINSIDNSIVAYPTLSQTMIDGFITTVKLSRTSAITLRGQLETFSSSINGLLTDAYQQDQLANSINQKDVDIEKLETSLASKAGEIRHLSNDIDNLIIDNENQLNRKQTQIDSIKESIDVLNKELKDLLDGADANDIASQRNYIKQAELKLERTQEQKDKYQIISDFDGRVRSVDIVEGEQFKLDDRKYIVVENPNLVELELQVSQIDIVKIKEDDKATITFDTYPHKPIESIISKRSVNPEPNGRGGYYYKATIILNKQDLEILAGMSALVTVETNRAYNVIVIPTLGIEQDVSKKYVYKKVNGGYKKIEITTGISNNFQAEVTSGLLEGDVIRGSALDSETFKKMGIDESSSSFFGG